MAVRSTEATPAKACRHGPPVSTPPTTDEPAPYGMAATPDEAHQSRSATSSDSVDGRAPRSGGAGTPPWKARTTSRNERP